MPNKKITKIQMVFYEELMFYMETSVLITSHTTHIKIKYIYVTFKFK